MERRYRDVTLQRKKMGRKALWSVLALVLLWLFLAGISDEFGQDILKRGARFLEPEIFKYEEERHNSQITFLEALAPGLFSFVKKQEGVQMVSDVDVTVIVKKQESDHSGKNEALSSGDKESMGTVNDSASEQENSAHTKQEDLAYIEQDTESYTHRLVLALDSDTELALLQENIFEDGRINGAVIQAQNGVEELTAEELTQHLQNVENHVALAQGAEAVAPYWGYDMLAYRDMTRLIKDFYIIDASTSPDPSLLNAEQLTSYDNTLVKSDAGPQILIYHSHSQEGFADSVPGDKSTTIVGAGARLAELLTSLGYQVLHHEGVYDVPSRDDAYSNALPGVEQVLADNPTIEVVIDLHRDAVAEGTKLVTTIDGKDYARFMFFNGICRGTKGAITYLNNPYLKENLAFSFQSQLVAEKYFPGITRKIYLKAWRYNMHLKPRNMLIELGAQTNTVEEIMNTTEILAFIIDKVLSGQ